MDDISYRKRLAERIVEVRKLRDLTAKDLANAVGISPSYLSRIESGERALNTVLLSRLANALKVAVDDLFPRDPAVAMMRIGRSDDLQIQQMIDFAQRLREDIDVVEHFAARI
jgi:transcriptional regulator with XRE-family HTH domain